MSIFPKWRFNKRELEPGDRGGNYLPFPHFCAKFHKNCFKIRVFHEIPGLYLPHFGSYPPFTCKLQHPCNNSPNSTLNEVLYQASQMADSQMAVALFLSLLSSPIKRTGLIFENVAGLCLSLLTLVRSLAS